MASNARGFAIKGRSLRVFGFRMNVSSRRKRVESRAKPNDGTRDVWQVPLSETRLLLSVASRRARGFQGEIAGGPYQGHACRVPHHVVRGHRARNFCRSSPTLRKPSQISPSPLSLCFSFPPPITLPLFPLHTSLPRPPGVQHRDTLSHSRYPRPPVHRTVLTLFSFLLFFHSSVESLVPRAPPSFARRSWFVSVHDPLPSPSAVRRRENARIERWRCTHACVGTNAVSECEKRSGRVAMDPRRPRGFFHRSIISSLRRASSFLPLGRQFRERKTQEGEGRGDRLENESRRDAKRRRSSVERGEGDARNGDLRGGVKRSERWIFGNEVTSQRSRSRLRVTGRLIDVNRRLGDESAITFLSTRVSRETRSEKEETALETRAEEKERRSSSSAKFRTIIIPRECSPNLAMPLLLLFVFFLSSPR